ncbi:hypothetical protein GCM10022243_48890 [Saccharothrix violaceirubra]|uniref:Uncharacterized protein n=1 Tax=Saccharothrix violaceirubra TaxID=413306 RepID=A0A7W7WU27_9PSEU|nr:hypothetical protein [Saccharothrix violaceirubra]MBB4963769.1 hypothetical protein [Saccharothrix violaceirubra]
MTTTLTIPFTATLVAPLHHGAGTAGNTSLIRTQRMVRPDGTVAQVPFVSGNSLRHGLRAGLAWHAVRTLGVEDGGLSKAVVDLLWSGGAITRTGSQTDLALLRRVEHLYPPLALMGYSAAADMTAGTLAVDQLHLVCAENAWRLPGRLAGDPRAARPASAFRGEEFGTRHDVAGTPVDRYTALADELVPTTTQMIYEHQVVLPGAALYGGLVLTPAATDAQLRVLLVALDEIMPADRDGVRVLQLAAKRGVGYGTCRVDLDLPDGLPTPADARAWWEAHLVEHAEEITALWQEIVA